MCYHHTLEGTSVSRYSFRETVGLKMPNNGLSLQVLVFPAKCLLGARSKMKYYFAVVIAVKDLHLFPHRAGEMLIAFRS